VREEMYTITELEEKTGISRRTIHYYIKERLIPPAQGTGGGASYNDNHVMRLSLIKMMQKSHLKLSGIREALNAMTTNEIEELYEHLSTGEDLSNWNKDALENWMADPTEPDESSMAHISEMNISFLNEPTRRAPKQIKKGESYLQDLKRSKSPDETWERFYVLDGVEINVRSDIMNKYETLVHSWIKYLRSLI